MYVPKLLSIDPITPDHILVPLNCGHYASVYERSSWWDFPEDRLQCETCNDALHATADARVEIERMMDEPTVPEIRSDEIAWTDVGLLPKQELLAHVIIAGCDMHLSAIAVHTDTDGMQVAATPEQEDDLNHYAVASGHEGKFSTAEINGITYAIFATPFSA